MAAVSVAAVALRVSAEFEQEIIAHACGRRSGSASG
jgi:hypothetical protein